MKISAFMKRNFRHFNAAVCVDAADAWIVSDVASRTSCLPEPKRIHMRRGPFLENKDQFMLRAVECPHPGIGLVPHAEVLEFGEYDFASCDELFSVSPVHADESDCPVSAPLSRGAEGLLQKGCELRRGHLSDAHREFSMANPPRAADVAVDRHIVRRRIGKDQVGPFIVEKRLVRGFVASVVADKPVTSHSLNIAAM